MNVAVNLAYCIIVYKNKFEPILPNFDFCVKYNVNMKIYSYFGKKAHNIFIPVIFQVASLLAALGHPGHPGHIVIYASGDLLPCRRDPS
ncbi:hypothetical protein EAE91_19595 [Photorhabdus noenieputensis]|uniref:hypothetical protein n=1 Tax=Photorhabdus noenieputensis TaxID=1208607 RepID=UPI001BD25544|nr:hypothetical protein [Photorhabdus noenieputensis]MBS9439263.1 hypothetical protein [Photorhabdus noenieputensis]MCK3667333.1 hypothetical protein [Photorhabdus noenieputensis]